MCENFSFSIPISILSFPVLPYAREEINNLHTNVEFLTNRMNSASTAIAASNNAPIEAYEPISQEPFVSSSSIHSSPKNYNLNSYATTALQPDPSPYVDESNANNYSISNDTSYEPTSLAATQIENLASTPTKSIIRSNSIKNINDDDTYYNEPSSSSYVEPAGKDS
jgi:hypothetical protein